MAKDITIKDPSGTTIYYPKTVSQLVYDNDNGKTVNEEINELNKKTEFIYNNDSFNDGDSIIFKTDNDELIGTIDDDGADFVNLKKNNESVLTATELKTINNESIVGEGNLNISIDNVENIQTFDRSEKIIIGENEYTPTIVVEDGKTDIYGTLKINGVDVSTKSENSGIENVQHLGITDYQKPIKDINMIAIYGQSLSTGQQTCPELSRTNYRGNLMIGKFEWVANQSNITSASTFQQLYARSINGLGNDYIPSGITDQTNGETCGVNYCNAAKRLIDDYMLNTVDDRKFLDCSFGAGGKSIEILSKNCPNTHTLYDKLETAMTHIKNRADSDNKSICCTSVVWMQGEWNESSHEDMGWFDGEYSTTNKDDYKAYLIGGTTTSGVTVNGMVNDLIDTIKTKFGQDLPPIILGSQMGTNFIKFRELPIMMAQLEASNETDKYLICTPSYRVTDRGGHLDSNGERWLGELYAKVWYKVVILGEKWKPLQPISITRKDYRVEIEFHIPQPPLVFDTNQVSSITNYGFDLYLNNSSVGITDVSILGNKVILETGSKLEGILEVSYAGLGKKYGNLRDSDDWIAFETYKDLDSIVENPSGVSYRPTFEPTDENGNVIYNKKYPCQNFCVNFYYKLNEGENNIQIKI